MTTLKNGSRGEEVKLVQAKVGVTVDGIFGANTETAVKLFQCQNGLTADGIVGPKTWTAMGYPEKPSDNNPQPNNPTNNKVKILIDNGHGVDTPGKCSPDGKFREYRYTREIAAEIVKQLKAQGYDTELLTPEEKDISLTQRVERANAWCRKLGNKNVCLVSVHVNAAGNGGWRSAGGWCVYTSKGQTQGDLLATELYNAAEVALKKYQEIFPVLQAQGGYDSGQKPMRADWSDGDPDYEANFTIIAKSNCPAALTESLFQDNKKDVEFLESQEGRSAIISLHVKGIISYISKYCR